MTNRPRIGIRPIINGRRRGVRESLEDQTMNMARRVAALYEAELRYIDDNPIECVIAGPTIDGVAKAQATTEKFRRENVGLALPVTPCQAYGTKTIDMGRAIPHTIWGSNGPERPGATYLAAALVGHTQLGIPAFGIYSEHVQDANDETIPGEMRQRSLDYTVYGLAIAQMKGRSYLFMEIISMGIVGSVAKDEFWTKYLGIRNEYIDMGEFARRTNEEIYDAREYERASAWVRENFYQDEDFNPPHNQRPERYDDWWAYSIKTALIARGPMAGSPRLMEKDWGGGAFGRSTTATGLQGQRQWTDGFLNGDLVETILNTTSDWNDTCAPHILTTENNSPNGASMLFNHLLTNTSQLFSDVRTYWNVEFVEHTTGHRLKGRAAGGVIDLCNSGSTALDGTFAVVHEGQHAIKPWWEITEEDQKVMLEGTTFHPATYEHSPGGGMSTHFRSAGDVPVTMCRINLVGGFGSALQTAEGWTVELPNEVATVIENRTDRTWPTTRFVLNLTGEGPLASVYDMTNAWGANHGAISYSHIGARLITLVPMLHTLVSIHNVPAAQIFRPKSWFDLGTADPEGADYHACVQFSPLHG